MSKTIEEQLEEAEQRIRALEQTNICLMNRVERNYNPDHSSFSLFERNAVLRKLIEERTLELEAKNESLLHAKEVAEAAMRTRTTFLASMSHELRTPMNGIIGMASLCLSMELPKEARDSVQIIHDSAMSLLGVLGDILDFSKIDAGKLELSLQEFHFHGFLNRIDTLFDSRAAAANIHYFLDFPSNLPEYIRGDETRLGQVISNLLDNAMKFTPAGGTVQLKVYCDERLHVEVRDTGLGIDPAELKSLFHPFSQVGSPSKRASGTGLGLSICQRLVNLMGGELKVDSIPGTGTTFSFAIPFIAVPKPQAPDSSNTRFGLGLKALVVEDHPVNQKVAAAFLQKLGFDVLTVNNGREACSLLDDGKMHRDFTVVLMDCSMPEMDGYEATRLIRRFERESKCGHLPIVGVTAHALKGDDQACLEAGMDFYLSKPLSMKSLTSTLLNALNGRKEG